MKLLSSSTRIIKEADGEPYIEISEEEKELLEKHKGAKLIVCRPEDMDDVLDELNGTLGRSWYIVEWEDSTKIIKMESSELFYRSCEPRPVRMHGPYERKTEAMKDLERIACDKH